MSDETNEIEDEIEDDSDSESLPISPETAYRDIVVPESAAGQRIDLFLTQASDGFSRSQITQAIQADGATLDGRTVRPSVKIKAGQQIRFRLPEPVLDDTVGENIPLDILFEDDGMVVVNKPPGMVVHPARGNWTGTLTSALAFRFQSLSDVGGSTRPGIVHRLDRDTSGVIVIAKNNAVHMNLAEQFANRTVEKEYFAITAGKLDRDRDIIDAAIGRHPYQRDKMAIRESHATSKPASSFYEVIARHGRFTQVRVLPKTGRTHQIRVHLSHIGCPILCDRLYAGHAEVTEAMITGSRDPSAKRVLLDRQALHARRLTLTHPQTGKSMSIEAPLPDDICRVVDCLQAQ
ncbi:Pseudouridine synthase [Novipirellula aureliae]|uniref:Pseudouridine synthase n=1 Tax=Novipirellula aureliae TaxID=2527966 RepID=A0A5C6ECZ2_9BACT|nr:Pseudouridine synthase [Novipirellula aureliae]